MKGFRSAFRRRSSHSIPATGCKKKAVLIGIKYDTSGSPKCEAFGVLGGPHEDVYSVRSLLIGPEQMHCHSCGCLNAHYASVQMCMAIVKRT